MSDPLINLDNFWLKELNLKFAGVTATEGQSIEESHSFGYEVQFNKADPSRYKLEFSFGLEQFQDGKPVGMFLSSQIVGLFSFPASVPEEKRPWLIRYNGLTILYGVLRGIVSQTSGSFPVNGGKLILPTLMMNDVVKQIEEQKAAALSAKGEEVPQAPDNAEKPKAKPRKKTK